LFDWTYADLIANEDGRPAVLAMDQRATLRRMLDGAGTPSSDADLSAFKVDVVRTRRAARERRPARRPRRPGPRRRPA
jgi:tagatose-1,6-bisphosphate aldolase